MVSGGTLYFTYVFCVLRPCGTTKFHMLPDAYFSSKSSSTEHNLILYQIIQNLMTLRNSAYENKAYLEFQTETLFCKLLMCLNYQMSATVL